MVTWCQLLLFSLSVCMRVCRGESVGYSDQCRAFHYSLVVWVSRMLCGLGATYMFDRRMLQFSSIKEHISKKKWQRPHILVGDFNALYLADYTAEALEEVTRVRLAGHWEAPEETLLLHMLETYSDARAVAGPEEEHKIEFHAVHESPGTKFSGAWREWTPTQLDTSDLSRGGPLLSTCRFGTRIDYILLATGAQTAESSCAVGGRLAKEIEEEQDAGKKSTLAFVPGSYLVKNYMPTTDHNLVSVTVELS